MNILLIFLLTVRYFFNNLNSHTLTEICFHFLQFNCHFDHFHPLLFKRQFNYNWIFYISTNSWNCSVEIGFTPTWTIQPHVWLNRSRTYFYLSFFQCQHGNWQLFFLFKKNNKKTKVLYPSLIQWNLCVVLEDGCWFMEAALISKAALNNLSKSSRCF